MMPPENLGGVSAPLHAMTWDDSIGGDGGPLIVLQSGALKRWQGRKNFEKSLMNGGSIETDYDVICEAEECSVIWRHERDMLVLSDCSWAGSIQSLPDGETLIVQSFGTDLEFSELVRQARERPPLRSVSFQAVDRCLRLMVGADSGTKPSYGYLEVEILPGKKVCDLYPHEGANVLIICNR